MQALVHKEPRTLASRIMRWCSDAWEAATETDMIGRLDDQTLQELARDCAVTPDQLLQLTRSGPHAADQMAALMLAINIDPAEVARLYPVQYRDMQINCSMCGSKDRCRRDLDAQVLEREYVHYCGNADHLKMLQRDEPFLMA